MNDRLACSSVLLTLAILDSHTQYSAYFTWRQTCPTSQISLKALEKLKKSAQPEVERIDEATSDLSKLAGKTTGRRGARKGRKVSAATRAKMRAAWKKRKAEAKKGGRSEEDCFQDEGFSADTGHSRITRQ
jgi:Skp family chaperone for outer membrane proteins